MSTYVSIYSLITQLVKNSPPGDPSSIPESGKIPWRRDRLPTPVFFGFPCGLAGKESSHNVGDLVPSLGWEDALEKKKATPSSFLAWRTPWTIHGVAKSQTRLSNFPFSLSCIGEGNGSPLQCSCLENPRDGEAWWAAVYGVAQSRTRLK